MDTLYSLKCVKYYQPRNIQHCRMLLMLKIGSLMVKNIG